MKNNSNIIGKTWRWLEHSLDYGWSTVSILVRKANVKGSVSGFEIAPPSKGGGSDKHLAVN